MLVKTLQKPEESVRRPATIDDSVLLGENDNDLREIIAEIDPLTISGTVDALASQIRQIMFGAASGRRWTDVPPVTLIDLVTSVLDGINVTEWTAGEDIVRGQAVYGSSSEDTVMVARNTDLLHTNVVGLAYESKSAGERIPVAHTNKLMAGFANLVPGRLYFVQADGSFGLANPSPARQTYTLRAGTAKTSTTLLVNIGEPRVRP